MDVWIVKIGLFIAQILLFVLFQSTDNYDDTKLKQLWRYESFKKKSINDDTSALWPEPASFEHVDCGIVSVMHYQLRHPGNELILFFKHIKVYI
jgi:hypothetical protein